MLDELDPSPVAQEESAHIAQPLEAGSGISSTIVTPVVRTERPCTPYRMHLSDVDEEGSSEEEIETAHADMDQKAHVEVNIEVDVVPQGPLQQIRTSNGSPVQFFEFDGQVLEASRTSMQVCNVCSLRFPPRHYDPHMHPAQCKDCHYVCHQLCMLEMYKPCRPYGLQFQCRICWEQENPGKDVPAEEERWMHERKVLYPNWENSYFSMKPLRDWHTGRDRSSRRAHPDA